MFESFKTSLYFLSKFNGRTTYHFQKQLLQSTLQRNKSAVKYQTNVKRKYYEICYIIMGYVGFQNTDIPHFMLLKLKLATILYHDQLHFSNVDVINALLAIEFH